LEGVGGKKIQMNKNKESLYLVKLENIASALSVEEQRQMPTGNNGAYRFRLPDNMLSSEKIKARRGLIPL
jgi:hypothetical protein